MTNFLIEDVYSITGVGTIPVGRVIKGELKTGMKTNLEGNTFQVTTIEKNHEQIQVAQEGDYVGINVRMVSTNQQNEGFFKKLFKPDNSSQIFLKYKGLTIDFY
jgi:translation elongation factor EF-1alpha